MGGEGHNDNGLVGPLDTGSKTGLDDQTVRKTAYSMPASEAHLPEEMMLRAARMGVIRNRSEVVRAAMNLLANSDDETFFAAIMGVERLKPGRKT